MDGNQDNDVDGSRNPEPDILALYTDDEELLNSLQEEHGQEGFSHFIDVTLHQQAVGMPSNEASAIPEPANQMPEVQWVLVLPAPKTSQEGLNSTMDIGIQASIDPTHQSAQESNPTSLQTPIPLPATDSNSLLIHEIQDNENVAIPRTRNQATGVNLVSTEQSEHQITRFDSTMETETLPANYAIDIPEVDFGASDEDREILNRVIQALSGIGQFALPAFIHDPLLDHESNPPSLQTPITQAATALDSVVSNESPNNEAAAVPGTVNQIPYVSLVHQGQPGHRASQFHTAVEVGTPPNNSTLATRENLLLTRSVASGTSAENVAIPRNGNEATVVNLDSTEQSDHQITQFDSTMETEALPANYAIDIPVVGFRASDEDREILNTVVQALLGIGQFALPTFIRDPLLDHESNPASLQIPITQAATALDSVVSNESPNNEAAAVPATVNQIPCVSLVHQEQPGHQASQFHTAVEVGTSPDNSTLATQENLPLTRSDASGTSDSNKATLSRITDANNNRYRFGSSSTVEASIHLRSRIDNELKSIFQPTPTAQPLRNSDQHSSYEKLSTEASAMPEPVNQIHDVHSVKQEQPVYQASKFNSVTETEMLSANSKLVTPKSLTLCNYVDSRTSNVNPMGDASKTVLGTVELPSAPIIQESPKHGTNDTCESWPLSNDVDYDSTTSNTNQERLDVVNDETDYGTGQFPSAPETAEQGTLANCASTPALRYGHRLQDTLKRQENRGTFDQSLSLSAKKQDTQDGEENKGDRVNILRKKRKKSADPGEGPSSKRR